MMVKAILFDLDDTLYDERLFVRGGMRAVSKYVEGKSGIAASVLFDFLWRDFLLRGRAGIFKRFLTRFRLEGRLEEKLVEIYRGHRPRLRLYPGVRGMLERLRDKVGLALLTDGVPEVQRRKIRALSLERIFGVRVCASELGEDAVKPSGEAYRKALKMLNVEPREAVFVGDNPYKDFKGAREAGIFSVRVMSGSMAGKEALPGEGADRVVASVLEIEGIIDRFFPLSTREKLSKYASGGL